MSDFLAHMPKAELHIHLEGSLRPTTVSTLARRNGLDDFQTPEAVRQSLAARPAGLMGFLEHHFKVEKVMRQEQDFYDATYNLIQAQAANHVVYTELSFDPQAHTEREIPVETFMRGILAGIEQGTADFGVVVKLIACFHRELSPESALEMLAEIAPYREQIIGIGMDSGPESGNPPLKFKEAFETARAQGYKITGHHDVDVPESVEHMWQSLRQINIDRIDHGLNAVDDPTLMAELVRQKMCLTGSPVKRTTDPVMQDVDRITTLDKAGVLVSIHSDDPGEFETGYLTNMLVMFQDVSGYSDADMTRLVLNAFKAAWLPPDRKQTYIDDLRHYVVAHGVDWDQVAR